MIEPEVFAECSSLVTVDIPSSVSVIRHSAFARCISLKSICIPSSVKFIEHSTFSGCSSLESVTIPNGVMKIDNYAFRECHSIESISIPDSVSSIGDSAFCNCTSLSKVVIPEAVNSIGSGAFSGHGFIPSVTIHGFPSGIGSLTSRAKSVTIGAGCKSIPSRAFYECSFLESIEIHKSVVSIGSESFCKCSSLKTIAIPSSVTSIGDSAFAECTALRTITIVGAISIKKEGPLLGFELNWKRMYIEIAATNCYINGKQFGEYGDDPDEEVYRADGYYILRSFPHKMYVLRKVYIVNGITEIPAEAFNCRRVEAVRIPKSVTRIGWKAFRGNEDLESVEIPESVTYIAKDAFSGCNGLSSIKIDGKVIGRSGTRLLIQNNGVLTGFDVPNEECTVNGSRFTKDLENLTRTADLPWGITKIAEYAFDGCEKLRKIKIPSSVSEIGGGAFSHNSSLTTVDIQSSTIAYFPQDTLSGWDISNITICGDVIGRNRNVVLVVTTKALIGIAVHNKKCKINDKALKNIAEISEIRNLPLIITAIGYQACKDCSNLERVEIPPSVSEIGQEAFFNCSSLKRITIPSSVTQIGNWAFFNCSSLESIVIPSSVASIGACVFSECEKLSNVVISKNITKIGVCAFCGCSSLKTITIPSSVTEIESWAFSRCSSLVSITMPGKILGRVDSMLIVVMGCMLVGVSIPNDKCSINNTPFNEYESITEFVIPSGVTAIGGCAFWECSSLETITIPSSVTQIGERAFSMCSSIRSIKIPGKILGRDGSRLIVVLNGTPIGFGIENSECVVNSIPLNEYKKADVPSNAIEIGSWDPQEFSRMVQILLRR